MLPIERQVELEKFLLDSNPARATPTAIDYSNPNAPVASFSTETLLDALIALYD